MHRSRPKWSSFPEAELKVVSQAKMKLLLEPEMKLVLEAETEESGEVKQEARVIL